MNAHYRPGRCRMHDHAFSRRALLGGLLAGGAAAATHGNWLPTLLAGELKKTGKRLLIVNHNGGLSQLESWDLKLGADTGGPCLPIATSTPGLYISEWLPRSAKVMHHLCVLRGMCTGENNHGPAQYLMMSGRREGAALVYPHIGSVVHKYRTPVDHPVPGFVAVGEPGSPAFLGPQFGPVPVDVSKPTANLKRPAWIDEAADRRRQDFRRQLNQSFARRRGSAETLAYAQSFIQAEQLMRNKRLFDLSLEDPRQIDRYGGHEMAQRCLLALRLIEAGVTCVTVAHNGYDTHAENFNVHYDLLEQFDRPFACLVEDLAERGLLEDTVLVVTGEFGRTPGVNHRMGRDHHSWSWSCVVGGAGFPRGGVYGATNANGTEVTDGKIDAASFFHTLLTALGIDSKQNYLVDGEQVPIADPAAKPIGALLV